MNHVGVLDCTLRDGGYLVNKEFGDYTIKGIINGLVKAKIDYIEVGFLQDEGFGKGKTVFKNTEDVLPFLPSEHGRSHYALLADFSRYSIENLNEHIDGGIDAIRECFFKRERFEINNACRNIKDKGYKLFIQPVDILGYTDKELLELIDYINEIEPFCFSIVDTFGSMYIEDLQRIFQLIQHNLVSSCKIGFHSHNNMQLSNALSQEFIKMSFGKREVIIDGTLAGMGRGAGNTPTELIVQYLCSHYDGLYDMDSILDILDSHMDYLKSRCSWGYSTENFVAGMYGAHVNNVAYLLKKNSIRSKEIRQIIYTLTEEQRKRYDYALLDDLFIKMNKHMIEDKSTISKLDSQFSHRDVLIMAPGNTLLTEKDKILNYISKQNPIILNVNFLKLDILRPDYVYFSNLNRYFYWSVYKGFSGQKRIIASNIKEKSDDENEYIISFTRLISQGEYADNSTIMLLRFLDIFEISSIAIAGFDGYSDENNTSNYMISEMELENVMFEPEKRNSEIKKMLIEHMENRMQNAPIKFITKSKFSEVTSAN